MAYFKIHFQFIHFFEQNSAINTQQNFFSFVRFSSELLKWNLGIVVENDTVSCWSPSLKQQTNKN